MQIGAESYTQHPVRTDQESYYQLRNTSGHQSSTVHNDATAAPDYHENKCIIVIDIKKVFESGIHKAQHPRKWFTHCQIQIQRASRKLRCECSVCRWH